MKVLHRFSVLSVGVRPQMQGCFICSDSIVMKEHLQSVSVAYIVQILAAITVISDNHHMDILPQSLKLLFLTSQSQFLGQSRAFKSISLHQWHSVIKWVYWQPLQGSQFFISLLSALSERASHLMVPLQMPPPWAQAGKTTAVWSCLKHDQTAVVLTSVDCSEYGIRLFTQLHVPSL